VATLQDKAVQPIVFGGANPASTLASATRQIKALLGR
jgi:hypothetical protein